jgi:hypothetical protein
MEDAHILKVIVGELVVGEIIVFEHQTVCNYLGTVKTQAAVDPL